MVDPPSSDNPLVSVVLTTYNRKNLLRRALRSVCAQAHAPAEIIVCDDGSTDGTQQELAPEFPSINWLKQENKGVASARNLGIRHARGSWIALLDSDDEWKPEKLGLQLECMKRNPRSLACHTDEEWIRNGNQVIPPKFLDKTPKNLFVRSLRRCLICPSSALIHLEVFSEIGLFDESLPVCEDYDFWLPSPTADRTRACRPKARCQARGSPGSALHLHLGNGSLSRKVHGKAIGKPESSGQNEGTRHGKRFPRNAKFSRMGSPRGTS